MKKTEKTLGELIRLIKKLEQEVSDMEANVGFLNKETDPESYRRWYLSHQTVRNLHGYLELAYEKIESYNNYKQLPWWKKIFKRGV